MSVSVEDALQQLLASDIQDEADLLSPSSEHRSSLSEQLSTGDVQDGSATQVKLVVSLGKGI